MSDENGVNYRDVLEDIRRQKKELVCRYTKELNDLLAGENFALRQLGEKNNALYEPESPELERLKLVGLSLTEAAVWALKKMGKPANLVTVADFLHQHGYEEETEKNTLANSLYVTMKRKRSTLFVRHANRTWSLKEWRNKA